MDLDLKENSSDSDLSDSWTLLNCSEEDITSHKNGRGETSDKESVESDGIEMQGLPKRDEESDGISVISESDICDNTEAIPALESNISRQPLEDRSIHTLHSSLKRRRCHDSFSESDGCEQADISADLSICHKNGRKSRNNRPFPIDELDSSKYVEELRAEPSMQPKKKHRMRIYVHRPNDQINFILTILLALALAAVAGLGTGHFLGSKEVMMTPEETIYKLQQENQILHSQLQILLREREELRRNVRLSGKNINGPGQFYSECSKIMNNYLYFQRPNAFLNRSLINSNVPVFVSPDSVGKDIIGKKLEFTNFNSKLSSNHLPLSEQPKKNNANLLSEKVDHVPEIVHGSIINGANLKQISKGKISPGNIEYSGNTYQDNEATKLIIEMKSALSHGLALSNKLKEAISYLDAAFANWKKSDSATFKTYKNSVEKKDLKEFKHILHDGGKAKKILSKTVDKLDSIKQNIFKNVNGQNVWDDLIFKKKHHNLGPKLLSDIGHESLSNMYTNLTPIRSDSASSSVVIYGPHLPTSVSTSNFFCSIPSNNVCTKDAGNSVEINPLVSQGIMMEDFDIVSVEVEDGDTLPIGKANFNLSFELNQVFPKQLSGDLENKLKLGEISSQKVVRSINEVQSERDLNQIELPYQGLGQLPSEQAIRQISHESKQKNYPSKQSNKCFDQKPSHKKHFKMNFEEENLRLEENPKNHASKLQLQKSTQIHSEQTTSRDSYKNSVKISHEDFKQSRNIKSEETFGKDPSKPSQAFKEDYRIKFKDSSKSNNEKNYGNEKKEKKQEHKSSSKRLRNEKYEKEIKSEKKLKSKHEPKSKEHEFKRKDKFIHKKNNYESEKYNRKYNEPHKHRDDFKKNKYFHKASKQGKKTNTKYPDHIAWFVDERGHRFTNLTGEWLLKMNQARAKQRERTHKSDWFFDRAISRRVKREEDMERARWYFQRARSREICRVEPHSDWCKNQEKKGKFERSDHQFSDHDEDYNHYRRAGKTKRHSRPWRGAKFISHAFKAAMNFMKA